MSLEVGKLEKVRPLADGTLQARCPACAESGQDHRGEHLRVFADGRFGCCVHAKNREHRKRIFALAGETKGRHCSGGSFQVKVAARIQAVPPTQSVKDVLAGYPGTLGTAASESAVKQPSASQPKRQQNGSALEDGGKVASPRPLADVSADPDLNTDGTPDINPYTKKESICTYVCKDWEKGVPSVVSEPQGEKLPYLKADGTLVIPFDAPERYHWWKKGSQSVQQTLSELRPANVEVRFQRAGQGGFQPPLPDTPPATTSASPPQAPPSPNPTAFRTPNSELPTQHPPEIFYGDDL